MKYSNRYIARIVIEAETPIAVGGGNKDLALDRPVAKEANGIPFIPGTSLAGVLRHSIYDHAGEREETGRLIKILDDIFGYQNDKNQENSLGSRLSVSSAHLTGKRGKIFDGLCLIPEKDVNYEFIDRYKELPVRQHVRMSHRGAADTVNKGKFDEEVLYKGSRFIFEIEMKGTGENKNEDDKIWNRLLNIFNHPDFRIGGGSSRGFGQIKVKEIKSLILDLTDSKQRTTYLEHSSCLDTEFPGELFQKDEKQSSNYISYRLILKPEDFYLFSSGLKSDVADMNPVTEQIIEWNQTNEPSFSEELVLIPATSVKGAISHRVAYHYNKLAGNFADKLVEKGESLSKYVGENNIAVKALFGTASDYSNQKSGQKGAVRLSDIYRKTVRYKKLDHVAIDRFTGGTIDGALFNENVVQGVEDEEDSFVLDFWIQPAFMDNLKSEKTNSDRNSFILKAFEETLADICSGSLSLGGGTMRGNGIFSGVLNTNKNGKDETLYPNK